MDLFESLQMMKEANINKKPLSVKTEGVMDIVQNIKNYFKNKSNDRKAQAILQKITDKGGDIDSFFEELVPSSGKADTKAGELIRAMMRILYRDYNDGDKFNEGYGLETCGPAAAYLIQNDFTDLRDYAEEKHEEGMFTDDNDEEYTDFLNSVAEQVITYIEQNPQLLIEPNDEDMLETDTTELKELEPTTDFEVEIPYEVEEHIEAGNIDYNDVLWEVQSWDYCENAERYGDAIMIPDVNKEIYEELSRSMDKNMEYYAEELNDEYGDPNEEDYEDEDYDEDEDY